MLYLVSTTQHLLAIDTEARQVFRVHSGRGLYYGLAFSGDRIYAACRNETRGPENDTVRANEQGCLLAMDADTLEPIEIVRAPFPLRDMHGLCFHDGRLWITCSFDNLVAVYDLETSAWDRWYPSPEISARGRDVDHFNSVVALDGRLGIVAHRFGQSRILMFCAASLDLERVIPLGVQAHDLFLVGEDLGTCSSGEGALRSAGGWTLRTGGFPRGYARSVSEILVGLSSLSRRADRHGVDSVVRVFDSAWQQREDYVLRGVGMVLAVLPLPPVTKVAASGERWCDWELVATALGNVITDVYRVGLALAPVFEPEWHAPEQEFRWTSALNARMRVIVNSDDTQLMVTIGTGPHVPSPVEILIGDRSVGFADVKHSQPGSRKFTFDLPVGLAGDREVVFRVPELWCPARAHVSSDLRLLGAAVLTVALQ